MQLLPRSFQKSEQATDNRTSGSYQPNHIPLQPGTTRGYLIQIAASGPRSRGASHRSSFPPSFRSPFNSPYAILLLQAEWYALSANGFAA